MSQFTDPHLPVSLHFCTSNSWGGLEVYAGTLMAELSSADHRVIAVCAAGSPLESFLRERRVETVSLPGSAKISLRSIMKVRSIIRAEAVSIVHVHYHRDIWVASIAIRRNPRIRLFMSIYMGVGRKKDFLHRWVYHRVDAIFTSSKALNEVLPERYPVPASKIHYLPYGRYLDRYRQSTAARESVRAQFNIAPDEIIAGSMVRLDEGKGVMDFLRSYLYLDKGVQSSTVYLIVGEPTRRSSAGAADSPFEPGSEEYYRSLREFVELHGLGNRIIFAGYQQDSVAFFSAMDIFVFPSRDEMYSLAMLDAMAMSLPVIAARSGGNLLQVREGVNGLLYETGNSEVLAFALANCISDPALRARLGLAARQFVQSEHRMETVIERLKKFYFAA